MRCLADCAKEARQIEDVSTAVGKYLYFFKKCIEFFLRLFICGRRVSCVLELCIKFGDNVFRDGFKLLLQIGARLVKIMNLAAIDADLFFVFINLTGSLRDVRNETLYVVVNSFALLLLFMQFCVLTVYFLVVFVMRS